MNKRLVWFEEFILWLFIIIAVIIGFTYSFAKADQKNHSYYMFFKDVDGLAKGSPVRFMGFQIGYVRDVKVFDESIFVSFLVTKKNIYIPEGSSANVEFYGLGGSKSLEIYPPSAETPNPKGEIILTKNPYRVADYYKWGTQINELLEGMSTRTSSSLDAFTNSNFNLHFLNKNAQKINNMLQSFVNNDDDTIAKFTKKLNDFNKKYKNFKTDKNSTPKQNNINKEIKNDSDDN